MVSHLGSVPKDSVILDQPCPFSGSVFPSGGGGAGQGDLSPSALGFRDATGGMVASSGPFLPDGTGQVTRHTPPPEPLLTTAAVVSVAREAQLRSSVIIPQHSILERGRCYGTHSGRARDLCAGGHTAHFQCPSPVHSPDQPSACSWLGGGCLGDPTPKAEVLGWRPRCLLRQLRCQSDGWMRLGLGLCSFSWPRIRPAREGTHGEPPPAVPPLLGATPSQCLSLAHRKGDSRGQETLGAFGQC